MNLTQSTARLVQYGKLAVTAPVHQYLPGFRVKDESASRTARKRAGSRGLEVANEELYWRFLLAAAAFMVLGLLFLQEKTELWLQAGGAAVALTLVWTLTR